MPAMIFFATWQREVGFIYELESVLFGAYPGAVEIVKLLIISGKSVSNIFYTIGCARKDDTTNHIDGC